MVGGMSARGASKRWAMFGGCNQHSQHTNDATCKTYMYMYMELQRKKGRRRMYREKGNMRCHCQRDNGRPAPTPTLLRY